MARVCVHFGFEGGPCRRMERVPGRAMYGRDLTRRETREGNAKARLLLAHLLLRLACLALR